MSRRRKKKKKSSSSRMQSLAGLEGILGDNPVFAKMLLEGMAKGIGLPDLPLANLAAPSAKKPSNGSDAVPKEPLFLPQELADLLEDAAGAALRMHSQAIRNKAHAATADVRLTNFVPDSIVEAKVATNGARAKNVVFAYDHVDYEFELKCSCGSHACVHSYQLLNEIVNQLHDDDSEINRKIFGENYAEERRLAEQQRQEQERQQNQQRLLTMLERAGTGSAVESVPMEAQQFEEPERVLWNLNAVTEFGQPKVELKMIRQKEKKTGGWTKGREVTLKNFMEMPREGWTQLDWALAGKTKTLSWHPHYTLSNGEALEILAGSDVFYLNREPATLEIRPFEIVVQDTEDGGWWLTTSAVVQEQTWAGDALGIGSTAGTIIASNDRAAAVWIRTPPEMSDLNRFLSTERIVFAADQRDVLLGKLNELQGSVPLRLPASLAGDEVAEVTSPILLLRMKKTGALEATVCVRDTRQLLLLPGDGILRRQATVDGSSVQYIRDATAEQKTARAIVEALSLKSHRLVRDWTWLIDDPDAVVDLLSASAKLVDSHQLTTVWHKESARELNIIGSVSVANVSVKVSRQRDWFGVDGTCRIGDQEVALKDLLSGLRGATSMTGFVEVSPGKWAAIADEFRATLQRLVDVSTDNRGKLQLDASAAMSLSAIEEKTLSIEADKAWQKCLNKVRAIKAINPDPPAGLDCALRDYQIEGFRWMCRLSEWGVGGILADDMGLGKTVQTLAVLLQRMESGPSLVIAPTSLGFNWEQECCRFTPSLSPKLLREADRTDLIENASEGDLIICSYGLALRETKLLQTVNWGTLVLDEAQNIKNSNAKTSKEVRKLKAEWKVALTGTPMENHLGELWSIFRAVSPGVLGPWEQFSRKFAGPIEKENNDERRKALSSVISPFILRRSKKEVLTDLPERSESNLLIELSNEERERYDQVRLAAIGELDSLGDTEVSGDQRFRVLQLLTRLRQISCHVGLVDDNWTGGSSKLKMLMERLEQLKEEGNRPLIFSQFTSHLALIKEACDAQGITYQYLDGQTTPKARQQRVEAFQNGEGEAFLISLKAGGTGLNLTAADYVIHMDPWWNPAVEDQATDRAHRIGQKKSVMVYRIIAKGTIEEQILSLHEEKRDLVEGVLSGAEASAKMTTEQLAELIRDGVTTRM